MNRRVLMTLTAVAMLLGTSPSLADDHTDDYARTWQVDAKPGHMPQFMEAFAAHVKWRKDNGDPWTWITYTPSTGSSMNSLWVRSGNHTLAEMDQYEDGFGKKGNEHWMANVDPHVAGYSTSIS